MNLLDKFNTMIQKPVKPKGDQTRAEDDETLTPDERAAIARFK